ncbi:MAG: Ig-like domain-containing protein [Actinomycetes bacterium]
MRLRAGLVGLVGVGVLAACTPAGSFSPLSPAATESDAVISVNPAEGQTWRPDRPIKVSVADGTFDAVSVRTVDGKTLRGRFNASDTTWRSTSGLLPFGTKYVVTARAKDAAGLPARVRSTFRTEKPKSLVHSWIVPGTGAVVGVGMPIIVTFDQPVPNHAVAERHLSVTASPQQPGGWYWVSDTVVRYRPKTYWKSGTTVRVTSNQAGVRLGDRVWGDDNDTVRFSIGAAMVSTVDIGNHTMTVRRDGQVIRTIPVTTGKPGWDSRVGTKVIISKDREVVMDAATLDVPKNDPEYYRLNVEYAMRVTWSGEYVHAAPWSVADQGHANVSHGCTGMSNENAAWLYGLSKVGDVVNYVDGVRSMEPWNGYTDWNIPWAQWRQGSALS